MTKFDFILRWRDEAKSLTARFQVKSKELHGKVKSLRKENAELHKALLLYKQQFTQFKTDTLQYRFVLYNLREIESYQNGIYISFSLL